MKTHTKTLSAVAVVFVLTAAATAQDPVPLRYQASKEALIYRKVHKLKQTQTVMDKKITTDMTQTEIDQWAVAETEKKELQIKAETKRLQVKMKITGVGDYEFDSTKNDNEKGSTLGAALTPLYERLTSGMALTCTITPQGKLTKLEGYKELLGDVLKDNPLGQQLTGGASEEAAKLGLAEFIPLMSEKPVTQGQRWEVPFQLNLEKLGKATGKRLYAYEGEGKVGKLKTAQISVLTELSFELDVDMGGAKVTGTVSITQSKGTIHFDPKKGRLVSMSNEYTLSGNLNVAAGGQNIPVAMEQTQHMSMELLDSLPK
jgi:hypothetical protein